MSNSEASVASMPKVLREVALYAGIDTAMALQKHFAGQRLYVPKTVTESPIFAVLDPSQAERLVQTFGGEMLVIPSRSVSAAARRKQILELAEAGLSINDIAAEVGCSYRRVYQVLAQTPGRRTSRREAPHDPRQGDLF